MRVRFWGVRGSIPVAGAGYEAGGNTSCVEVEHDGYRLIFDGGTGLRGLSDSLGPGAVDATILFSHYHWDHIQGVPFFVPAYNPKSNVTFAGMRSSEGWGVREVLDRQMQPPAFPVRLDALLGATEFLDVEGGRPLQFGPFTVRAASQPHPSGATAYRVDAGQRSVVYATDTEHGLAGEIDPNLVALAADTDLLIHDAQYLTEEYAGQTGPARRGWGHSTWNEAVRAATLCRARRLALYHHDPTRHDRDLAELEAAAREHLETSFAAREGAVVEL